MIMTITFTRNSTAFQQNGTLVNTNLPRYEFARFPNWRWRDLFDTNQLATEYVSGGDAVATWSVTGGVLSATGGTRATLLKTSLTLTDGEIIINTNQAHDGGIIARHVDNSNYYTLKLSDDSGAFPVENLRLVRRVAGVITQLASANVTWVRGVSANVRFTFHGSLLEAWFNGVRVISVVDTSFVAGGVGLRNNHTTAFRVLDFTVHQAQRGITVEEGVTNLLPVAVSRAESELLSNHNTFGTIATDTTFGRSSAPSARYTQIAVGGFQGFYTTIFPGITAGLAYTASVHVFSAMRSLSNVNFDLMWHRADNSVIFSAASFHTNTVNQWSRFVIAATAPAEATQVRITLHVGSGIQVGDVFWFDDVQLEQKPYAASWQPGGSPRAAEVLTVPSSVFNRGNWTVEGIYTPQIPMTLGNILKTLKSYQIDANNNLWFGITADARWRLAITSGGTVRAVESATGAAVIGTPYHWQIGGDGSVMRLCVNGVQIGTDTAYVEPVGALPVNIHIGASQDIVLQANGLIHNVRFSNRARSLAEHQAAFNTGQPLAVDANTIALWSFNNNLNTTMHYAGNTAMLTIPSEAITFGLNHSGNTTILNIPSESVAFGINHVGNTAMLTIPFEAVTFGIDHVGNTAMLTIPSEAVTFGMDHTGNTAMLTIPTETVAFGVDHVGHTAMLTIPSQVITFGVDHVGNTNISTIPSGMITVWISDALFRKIAQSHISAKNREVNIMKSQLLYDFEYPPFYHIVQIGGINRGVHIISDQNNNYKIFSKPDETLNIGDVVVWNDNNWLIVSILDDRQVQTKGLMSKCDYTFDVYKSNILYKIPCVKQSSQLSTDTNQYLSDLGDNIIVCVANNSITQNININDVYKIGMWNYEVQNISDIEIPGLFVIKMKITEQSQATHDTIPADGLFIEGSDVIRLGSTKTYIASKYINGVRDMSAIFTFSILENTNTSSYTLTTVNNTSCTIKCNEHPYTIILRANSGTETIDKVIKLAGIL